MVTGPFFVMIVSNEVALHLRPFTVWSSCLPLTYHVKSHLQPNWSEPVLPLSFWYKLFPTYNALLSPLHWAVSYSIIYCSLELPSVMPAFGGCCGTSQLNLSLGIWQIIKTWIL